MLGPAFDSVSGSAYDPIWIPLGRGKFLAGLRRPGMCAATGLHEIQNMEPMAGQVTGRQTGTFVPEC